MELELEDNLKAHVLQPDGTFEKPDRRGKAPVGSQAALCALAVKAAERPGRKMEAKRRPGCLSRWKDRNKKESV